VRCARSTAYAGNEWEWVRLFPWQKFATTNSTCPEKQTENHKIHKNANDIHHGRMPLVKKSRGQFHVKWSANLIFFQMFPTTKDRCEIIEITWGKNKTEAIMQRISIFSIHANWMASQCQRQKLPVFCEYVEISLVARCRLRWGEYAKRCTNFDCAEAS